MIYDVVVVGAGPAGCAASKKCAERGLRTLILEKRRFPREKICSGMLMGSPAQDLVKQEFGPLPETVLTEPPHLSGYQFHVPGVGHETLDHFTLLTWRRDLDDWMSQKARSCGVDIWENSRVVDVRHKEKGFSVIIERDRKRIGIEAFYLIGADGAGSRVRKCLFPEIKIRYSQIYQEYHRGDIHLDKGYFHWFYPVEISPSSFTVHYKDGITVLDVSGRPGQIKNLLKWAKNFLNEMHGFPLGRKPVWRGSCLAPILYRELTNQAFRPARGNALLVGDAAGFIMPVSGEGIGNGIKSALSAVDAITGAMATGETPETLYLEEISGILSDFREIYPWFRKIMGEAESGGNSLPRILKDAYERTLRVG